MILFAAKSENIFQNAIMLVILIKYIFKKGTSFLSKILLSRCVGYFIKGKKRTCSSSIVELYKHSGVFKNTREVREARAVSECSSKHFSGLV